MISANVEIAILGAGAVGQLICHQLHAAGIPVGFIGKNIDTRREQQLSFTAFIQPEQMTSKALESHYSVPIIEPKLEALSGIKLIIVCVKAYQVLDAITPLLDKLSSQCHILLLHNGMGPHLALAPLIGTRGLSLGTTSQGVLRHNRWQIKQTGHGLTQIGHFSGQPLDDRYRHLLLEAIPNCEWVDAIIPCLWQKLAVNAAINPLTAIHKCTNGTLAQPQFNHTIAAILDELVYVAAQDGIQLDRVFLQDRVYRVITLTAGNFSSMHQDVAHQRQTEIDQINGYICERAKVHGLSATTNTEMCTKIKQLETSKSSGHI
ncbi:2-dehydropantoate 2-reductase [Shewanella profunda]|uniref:ketopantoate reductase family protein n=1 Tax=Shewanella profunda TaxID=254793 RepID=UPI00200F2631|nr:2-dehydropantoate 2-reductase [Shewanella profunda]MCL1088132.1 2-dehydropantoate 2-reductase [Shewanella profunda]